MRKRTTRGMSAGLWRCLKTLSASIAFLGLLPLLAGADDTPSGNLVQPTANHAAVLPEAVMIGVSATAPLRWVVGRTPAVFQPRENQIATRVGGWFDFSFEANDLPNTGSSFTLNHFNLYADTRFRDRWQAFLEIEYEHESDRSGFEAEREFEIEQAYVRYNFDENHHLRFGDFNTPFGYWTPLHWSILMETIEKPLHEGNRLVPEQQFGAEFGGNYFVPLYGVDTELSYALFMGYGDDPLGFSDGNARGVTSGVDLHLTFDDRHQIGVSVYRQKNGEAADRIENNVMLYGYATLPGSLLFRTEYMHQHRSGGRQPGLDQDVDLFYANLRWDFIDPAYLNYRFSYGEDDASGRTVDHVIHTFTLGVRPYPSLLCKLEYSAHDFRHPSRKDFGFWGFSVGYRF